MFVYAVQHSEIILKKISANLPFLYHLKIPEYFIKFPYNSSDWDDKRARILEFLTANKMGPLIHIVPKWYYLFSKLYNNNILVLYQRSKLQIMTMWHIWHGIESKKKKKTSIANMFLYIIRIISAITDIYIYVIYIHIYSVIYYKKQIIVFRN